jgi:hypothetical protein
LGRWEAGYSRLAKYMQLTHALDGDENPYVDHDHQSYELINAAKKMLTWAACI